MSYDITIWCVDPFVDPALLPSAEKWAVNECHWSFEARSWLLNTGPSDRVLEEDIPEEVAGLLPGIQHMVGVSLEPLQAPKAGLAMLRRFAKAVARTAHGVILDPQDDTVELARGTKRYVSPKRDKAERFGLLEMSWWMTNDRLLQQAHLEAFVDLLQKVLPEALPRRYGQYEPPQHLYAETGLEHLKSFLAEHLTDSPVWYSTRPVGHWSFSLDRECGWQQSGPTKQYRCNHLSISFDTAALLQPGWPQGLRRFWRKVSHLVQPFFGDVRTLNGYTGRLPHAMMDAQTENHPTCSWWWKGVPPKLGHAVVVGEPYTSLWPQLRKAADSDEALLFATTNDWRSSDDVSDLVEVPADIALPFMPQMQKEKTGGMSMRYPETYPEKFPFGPLPPAEKSSKSKSDKPKSGWKFWRR